MWLHDIDSAFGWRPQLQVSTLSELYSRTVEGEIGVFEEDGT